MLLVRTETKVKGDKEENCCESCRENEQLQNKRKEKKRGEKKQTGEKSTNLIIKSIQKTARDRIIGSTIFYFIFSCGEDPFYACQGSQPLPPINFFVFVPAQRSYEKRDIL